MPGAPSERGCSSLQSREDSCLPWTANRRRVHDCRNRSPGTWQCRLDLSDVKNLPQEVKSHGFSSQVGGEGSGPVSTTRRRSCPIWHQKRDLCTKDFSWHPRRGMEAVTTSHESDKRGSPRTHNSASDTRISTLRPIQPDHMNTALPQRGWDAPARPSSLREAWLKEEERRGWPRNQYFKGSTARARLGV